MPSFLRLKPMIAMLTLLSLMFISASRALAHADYVSSEPPANGTVTSAPERVIIVFSQELKPEGNTIRVTDARGNQVDRGDTTLDRNDPNRKTLIVSLSPGLSDGVYTVNWKNASTDGHSETGRFRFTINTGTTPAATPLPATSGEEMPGLALLAVGSGALLIGWALRRRVWQR
ncbi:copper resistance CopC family protein [Roseiflexus castenholzii]|jgi:methionine-rich copper-binding protein CopC|uniref:Copper resistance protein CopC n=1 Tax=Roseiflexus castenholzii (strain DSM 13941 / HLO8) TaxID=383372 RepID=A7NME5_ROSCS|nr:copper resistance protein CopC [Roseiflexus castenholzii]ABU58707.1 copper resistance protein CopC [Roseiflexus castenholzii DSM 13941]